MSTYILREEHHPNGAVALVTDETGTHHYDDTGTLISTEPLTENEQRLLAATIARAQATAARREQAEQAQAAAAAAVQAARQSDIPEVRDLAEAVAVLIPLPVDDPG